MENQFEKWKKSRVLEKRIKQVIESIDWYSFYENDSLKATILYTYDLNAENRGVMKMAKIPFINPYFNMLMVVMSLLQLC